jgi:predicted phosphodiesterase
MSLPPATQRRTLILFAAGVLLLVAVAPGAPQTTTSRTVAVIGDFGILMDAERNIDRAAASGAQGLIGLGDYNYDGSLRGWKAMADPLTSKGAWFARGNHDSVDAFGAFMPGGSSQWSTLIAGVRVIGIDTEQRIDAGTAQYNWFVGELSKEPASAGKIVVMHKPWWLGSGATHPGSEFPGSGSAMDGLLATHGVDMVFAGHEHNYQRTQHNNIPYLIVGTGGRSVYAVAGQDPATVASCACIGHVLLTMSPAALDARFIKMDGTQTDAVQVPLGGTGGFSASFTNQRGNNYWVETDVNANQALAGVDLRVNGGAWTSMAKQSWGSWAKSISVPTGSKVEFLARSTSGETSQSGTYTWPPGATTSPTPTTSTSSFSASFRNARGNEWWVEVDVTGNQPIAGVDVRVAGGTWNALAKQSWGSWAKSVHVPPGSVVEFRATSSTGATAVSSGVTWPPPA